jgi:hypothetical protein
VRGVVGTAITREAMAEAAAAGFEGGASGVAASNEEGEDHHHAQYEHCQDNTYIGGDEFVPASLLIV